MRWVLIPGLGSDHRLFANLLDLLPDRQILRFEPPHEDDTIEGYAGRLRAQIDGPNPFILAGVSFGGMLCSIMCQEADPAAVVLMSSTARPDSLREVVRVFEWMSRVRAETLVKWLRALGSHPLGWLEPIGPAHADQFRAMVRDTDVTLIRRCGRMIMKWRRTPRITAPIYHLHGALDRLIPVSSVQPTRIVAGAGHLLNLTHAEAVRDFVREINRQERLA